MKRTLNVFHALPLSGYTDENIKTRLKAEDDEIKQLFASYGVDIVILHPHMEPITDEVEIHRTRHMSLLYFGLSLSEGISKADIVCFGHNWKSARGCMVEHYICSMYNLPCIELDKPFDDNYMHSLINSIM